MSASQRRRRFCLLGGQQFVNLLIRALKTQGRIDILSRPQITTMDNQQSQIVVGESVPYVQGASISTLGTVTPIINYRNTGVILQVTPRISPDGKVIMRVHPEVSALEATTVNLGNGVLAPQFNGPVRGHHGDRRRRRNRGHRRPDQEAGHEDGEQGSLARRPPLPRHPVPLPHA